MDELHGYDVSVGYIVFRRDNEIAFLLMRQKGKQFWDFPKGRLEQGENLQQAAARELLEEAGIDNLKPLDFKTGFTFKSDSGTHRKVILFLGETEQNVQLSDEHEEFVWLPYAQAREYISYEERKQALDEAARYLGL